MKALLKYTSLALVILTTTVIQYSFLPHFTVMGIAPNILFILFFTFVFFESNASYFDAILTTFTIGFFIDIFSQFYFGSTIFFLFVLLFLVKTMMHFLQERQEKYFLIYFIALFVTTFTLYSAILDFTTTKSLLIDLLCNTILAIVVFLIYQFLNIRNPKQLRLFS